jgi:hypothetical protein
MWYRQFSPVSNKKNRRSKLVFPALVMLDEHHRHSRPSPFPPTARERKEMAFLAPSVIQYVLQ